MRSVFKENEEEEERKVCRGEIVCIFVFPRRKERSRVAYQRLFMAMRHLVLSE